MFYRAGDAGTEYDMSTPRAQIRERIDPHAFDKAIRENADVRSFFNHNNDLVLGRTKAGTLKLSVVERGLKYRIALPNTTAGRDVLESVRRGDVSGSSFMFGAESVVWSEEKSADGSIVAIRTVTSLKLYEVGPVTFPAYASTWAGASSESTTPDEPLRTHGRHNDKAVANAAAKLKRLKALEVEEQQRKSEQWLADLQRKQFEADRLASIRLLPWKQNAKAKAMGAKAAQLATELAMGA